MSGEKKLNKSPINRDEMKWRGQRAVEYLSSTGRWLKEQPPQLAKYAGGVVGIFEEARKNPDAELLARAGVRIAKEQHNVDSIARQAGANMQPEEIENIRDIDEDWKASFVNETKNISDKEMQFLWSEILRGKARDSGSFSKRTVKLVGEMEKKDAEMFTHFCRFVVGDYPFIYNYEDAIYNKYGRMFDAAYHLSTIGLLSVNDAFGYSVVSSVARMSCSYYGRSVLLHPKKERDGKYVLSHGRVRLTNEGRQLLPICGATPDWEFWDYLCAEWKKQGYKLSPVPHP